MAVLYGEINMVEFRKITFNNMDECFSIAVHKEQEAFVSNVMETLAQAYVMSETTPTTAYGVYVNDVVVGFIIYGYHTGQGLGSEIFVKNCYHIWCIIVDKNHQGKGYGRQMVEKMIAEIKTLPHDKGDYIYTSYDLGNVTSKTLFDSLGFVDTGERFDDDDDEIIVRLNISSVQATPEHIRQMIKDADGDVFEDFPSLDQDLTFNQCKDAFTKRSIEFDENKFDVLGIYDLGRQAFTNLGLLLSDQCHHTIKVAVFEDVNNTIFKGRKEFSGSILKQIDEAFAYIELNNNTQSEIKGLTREDFDDYPTEALRETLLNAVIHRNYDFSGSIIVNINSEFMEFISIGGLMPGLNVDEMLNGVSILRNEKLSGIFLRLRIIEAYGTGIRRIFSLYDGCVNKPQINATQNSFKMTLFNMNHSRNAVAVGKELAEKELSSQEELILGYLEQYDEATDEKIQELLNVKKTRAFVIIKQMSDRGLVRIIGRGASRKITL